MIGKDGWDETIERSEISRRCVLFFDAVFSFWVQGLLIPRYTYIHCLSCCRLNYSNSSVKVGSFTMMKLN